MQEYLVFEMKSGLFGLVLDDIKRIIMPIPYSKIPLQDECVLGVIKVEEESSDTKTSKKKEAKDEIFGLIDLSLKINKEPCNPDNESNRIILIKDDEKRFAIIVDKVHNIEEVEDEDITEVSFGKVSHRVAKISKEDKDIIFTILTKDKIFIKEESGEEITLF